MKKYAVNVAEYSKKSDRINEQVTRAAESKTHSSGRVEPTHSRSYKGQSSVSQSRQEKKYGL